jgi:hypothetical protein
MSNIKKQSQNLDKITGVQDLLYEEAATCSGGRLTLWNGTNRTGISTVVTGNVGDLGGFRNIASSFQVEAGTLYRLYTGLNRTGSDVVLGGFFGQSGNFGIGFDNNVESVARLQ